MVTWDKVYKARFGKNITEDEKEVWELQIADEIRRPTPNDEEITKAVVDIATTYRKAGKNAEKYPPNVNDVLTTIIRLRWQDSKDRKNALNASLPTCALCKDNPGYMKFAAESQNGMVKPSTITVHPKECDNGQICPCACSLGESHVVDFIGIGDRRSMDELRSRVKIERIRMMGGHVDASTEERGDGSGSEKHGADCLVDTPAEFAECATPIDE